MQRDPNKRLGALKDAQEIKQHVFFKGVNWDSVLKRELKPPVPISPCIPNSSIPPEKLYGELSGNDVNKIGGWTFISEDNNL